MLAGARVLVTGAAGFVGANLVRSLLRQRAEVIVVVRPSTNGWRLRGVESKVLTVPSDIRLLAERTDITDVDFIYHLASVGVDQRLSDVAEMLETNVQGTYSVLRLAERLRVRRLVHVGSSGEYGSAEHAREDQALMPNSEYGAMKAAATMLVHAFGRRTGVPAVTLRPFSVFGPFEAPQRLVPYCIIRALTDRTAECTDGRQVRDYVYIDDLVRALLRAATAPQAEGIVLNICTGISTTVREMVMRIVRLTGCESEPRFGVVPHGRTEMWQTSGDFTRARLILNWQPETSLDEGISATIDWFRKKGQDYSDVYG